MTKPGSNVQRRHFPAGHELISQGDPGDAAWLIESGTLQVVSETAQGEIPLATIGKGAIVGEMALIDQGPRSATVRTLTEVHCVELTRASFEQLIGRCEPLAGYLLESLVALIRRVQGLPLREWRTGSAEIRSSRSSQAILKRQMFNEDYVFFRQNEPAENAFLIQSGRVKLTRYERELSRLGPGRIFGAISLITGSRRLTTAVADDQVICEQIPKRQFDATLAAMPPILRALTKIYAEQLVTAMNKPPPQPPPRGA